MLHVTHYNKVKYSRYMKTSESAMVDIRHLNAYDI